MTIENTSKAVKFGVVKIAVLADSKVVWGAYNRISQPMIQNLIAKHTFQVTNRWLRYIYNLNGIISPDNDGK